MSRRFLVLLPALALLGACVGDAPPRSYYGGSSYDRGYGGTYYDRSGSYDRSYVYRDGRRRGWSDGYDSRRGDYYGLGWNDGTRADPHPPGP